MPEVVMMVGAMAQTIFLRPRTVVDQVQQPLFGKEGERAKHRRGVGGLQLPRHILKRKCPLDLGVEGLYHQQAHRRHADALLHQYLLVVVPLPSPRATAHAGALPQSKILHSPKKTSFSPKKLLLVTNLSQSKIFLSQKNRQSVNIHSYNACPPVLLPPLSPKAATRI